MVLTDSPAQTFHKCSDFFLVHGASSLQRNRIIFSEKKTGHKVRNGAFFLIDMRCLGYQIHFIMF